MIIDELLLPSYQPPITSETLEEEKLPPASVTVLPLTLKLTVEPLLLYPATILFSDSVKLPPLIETVLFTAEPVPNERPP